MFDENVNFNFAYNNHQLLFRSLRSDDDADDVGDFLTTYLLCKSILQECVLCVLSRKDYNYSLELLISSPHIRLTWLSQVTSINCSKNFEQLFREILR